MSEEFWFRVLNLAQYTLGGLGLLILFLGWPRIFKRCKCDKCKNFKDE